MKQITFERGIVVLDEWIAMPSPGKLADMRSVISRIEKRKPVAHKMVNHMTIGEMDPMIPLPSPLPWLDRAKEQFVRERELVWNIAGVITSKHRPDLTQQAVYDAILKDAQCHPSPTVQWAENALHAARIGRPLPWES